MRFGAYLVTISVIILSIIRPAVQIDCRDSSSYTISKPFIQYSPAILRSLRPPPIATLTSAQDDSNQRKLRKRGKKGGVRARFRRKAFKPPLPAIVTGNARSLNNKLDELSTNTRFLSEYREAGLICITETWFTENCPDSGINIDGFSVYRSDRTAESGKTRGGGVCAYINNKWCNNNNTHVTERTCTPDIEVLSLSLRPYYLPREFPKVNLNVVYVPPQANAKRAEDYLSNPVQEQQNKSPDSVILITGDFNHSTLESSLPTFFQYVTCPTRKEKILDLCYGNIAEGYKSTALPPLVTSLVASCIDFLSERWACWSPPEVEGESYQHPPHRSQINNNISLTASRLLFDSLSENP
ncbi:hypothetical protein EGW08_009640 [Elysia chlorotica]|uniref:Endonuclease/exonuclease/phosphatase domain-containing protein n=1 Tax=Elysia chlorotica TaxID=188477 RepID=A0A433TM14_ELYCH|nr:hypothetical protein EGW08_009640 [Elysia chlorotica]